MLHKPLRPPTAPRPYPSQPVCPTVPRVAPQVNVTLLDINDNHPTWKDAPYYINLVEMTPPDSDVTTVGGGQWITRLPLPRWVRPSTTPVAGLWGLMDVLFSLSWLLGHF